MAADGHAETDTGVPADEQAMQPHQADALLDSIMGTQVDLTEYAVEDAQAVVAAITGSTPTVVSRSRRRLAAE